MAQQAEGMTGTGGLTLVGQAASALWWPSQMEVFRIDTDSMSPTVKEGDYVVVDTTQRDLREAVYALRYGETVVIRRLQLLPGNKILIKLDNPAYKEEEVDRVILQGEAVIGRVVLAERHFH